jgi:hypothetical protein
MGITTFGVYQPCTLWNAHKREVFLAEFCAFVQANPKGAWVVFFVTIETAKLLTDKRVRTSIRMYIVCVYLVFSSSQKFSEFATHFAGFVIISLLRKYKTRA